MRGDRSLFTLVENRTAYSYEVCELNLFETHQQASNVNLVFDHFVLTSMITGKKVMTLPERPSFDYLPGESVILPPGELMQIDFPEAERGNPTQCLALTISNEVICQTMDRLNEQHTLAPTWGNGWEVDPEVFHLANNGELADTINRIVRITKSEQGTAKDLMVELTVQEMLIRLMQTQARVVFQTSYHQLASGNSLAAVIGYIKTNLRERISLDKLADLACMSRASFYKKFKEALGITPNQFILQERIRLAQEELQNPRASITSVCLACGFENLSHFTRSFKQQVGMSPRAWQQQAIS